MTYDSLRNRYRRRRYFESEEEEGSLMYAYSLGAS